MKVLIADDSDAIVKRLVAAIADVAGVEVIGRASTVVEADRAIRALRPDLVILDLHMPGGHGIDILDGLRRDGLAPAVIVLTNYDHPQFRRKSLEKGARFFFDKATDFDMVAEAVSMLARYREAENA